MTLDPTSIIDTLASGAVEAAGAFLAGAAAQRLRAAWSGKAAMSVRARLARILDPRRTRPVRSGLDGRRTRGSGRRGAGRRQPPRR